MHLQILVAKALPEDITIHHYSKDSQEPKRTAKKISRDRSFSEEEEKRADPPQEGSVPLSTMTKSRNGAHLCALQLRCSKASKEVYMYLAAG